MSSKVLSCHGCRSTITTKNYLTCCLCVHTYDLDCANITEQRFLKTMTKEVRSSWKCPECVNKVPKAGNVNTPVGAAHGSALRENQQRISTAALSQSDIDNATVQRGSSGSSARRVLDHSYVDDTYYLDNMRTVIRDELERVMDERVSILITKIVTEQVTLPICRIISELTDRVAILESKLEAFEKDRAKGKEAEGRMMRPTDGLFMAPSPSSPCAIGEAAPRVVGQTIPRVQSSSRRQAAVLIDEPTFNVTMNKTAGPGGPEPAWKEVTKKRTRVSPVGVMRGEAAPGSTKLEAAERRRYLHLYYVKVGTTEAEVSDYLNALCGGNSCLVETLKARGSYASFKLDVPSKLADSIMTPGNWAEDICVKPWRQSFRPKTNEGQ